MEPFWFLIGVVVVAVLIYQRTRARTTGFDTPVGPDVSGEAPKDVWAAHGQRGSENWPGFSGGDFGGGGSSSSGP